MIGGGVVGEGGVVGGVTRTTLMKALVLGPTKPTGSMPLRTWYCLTADSVREPKYPVGMALRRPS